MNQGESFHDDLWPPPIQLFSGLRFHCLGTRFPEQYDVYVADDKQIGYVRLRHGNFSVDCPDVGGDRVLEDQVPGGGGFFEDVDERNKYLQKAADAIIAWMEGPKR